MADKKLSILVSVEDGFSKALSGIEKSLKSHEQTFKAMAVTGTAVFAGLSAGVYSTVKAFSEQERAETRLSHITRQAVGATDDQIQSLKNQASALQTVGVIGDEVTLMAMSQLATFDLQTSTIEALTPAMLDMIVAERGVNATQEEMLSIANGLGKALQGQTELLTKQGFQFSESQKAMLENGTEMERVAMLSEILSSTYGGMNEAMRGTAEGGLRALNNSFGDAKESIGKAFIPALNSITGKLVPIADGIGAWASNNSELIATLAPLVAAIAGVVAVVGGLGLALPAITAGIVALTSPIGLITVAVAGLAYAFYEAEKAGRHWASAMDQSVNMMNDVQTAINVTSGVEQEYQTQKLEWLNLTMKAEQAYAVGNVGLGKILQEEAEKKRQDILAWKETHSTALEGAILDTQVYNEAVKLYGEEEVTARLAILEQLSINDKTIKSEMLLAEQFMTEEHKNKISEIKNEEAKVRAEIDEGIKANSLSTLSATADQGLKTFRGFVDNIVASWNDSRGRFKPVQLMIEAVATVAGAVGGAFKNVNDAIISPNGDIITTHPDDYIIATKNPGGLGGGAITINITGNTFMDRGADVKLGDMLLARLKNNLITS